MEDDFYVASIREYGSVCKAFHNLKISRNLLKANPLSPI